VSCAVTDWDVVPRCIQWTEQSSAISDSMLLWRSDHWRLQHCWWGVLEQNVTVRHCLASLSIIICTVFLHMWPEVIFLNIWMKKTKGTGLGNCCYNVNLYCCQCHPIQCKSVALSFIICFAPLTCKCYCFNTSWPEKILSAMLRSMSNRCLGYCSLAYAVIARAMMPFLCGHWALVHNTLRRRSKNQLTQVHLKRATILLCENAAKSSEKCPRLRIFMCSVPSPLCLAAQWHHSQLEAQSH